MHAGIKFDEGDFRRELPMFQIENFIANLAIRDQLADLAKKKGCTLPQLAITWLLSQGENVIPIPGTKHTSNLSDNLGALDVTLERHELDDIQQLTTTRRGLRYPVGMFTQMNMKPEGEMIAGMKCSPF